jgi:hypothetical protein
MSVLAWCDMIEAGTLAIVHPSALSSGGWCHSFKFLWRLIKLRHSPIWLASTLHAHLTDFMQPLLIATLTFGWSSPSIV